MPNAGLAITFGRPLALARRAGIVGKFIFEIGAEPLFDGAAAYFQAFIDAIRGSAGLPRRLAVAIELPRHRLGRAVDHARLAFGGTFKQGIFFKLALNVGGELQVGELQQLDRLHQLRRHHQRLALAHLQSLSQCHQVTACWSGSCLSKTGPVVYRNAA